MIGVLGLHFAFRMETKICLQAMEYPTLELGSTMSLQKLHNNLLGEVEAKVDLR